MEDRRARRPTKDDRAAGRTHVVYELRLLREVVDAHTAAMGGGQTPAIDVISRRRAMCTISALRDSALMHLRTLYEFFTKNTLTRDDMAASDYFGDSSWSPSSELVELSKAIEDINKFRSHLTYTRTDRSRAWSLESFMHEIERAFDGFLQALDDDERDRWMTLLDDDSWLPVRNTGRGVT